MKTKDNYHLALACCVLWMAALPLYAKVQQITVQDKPAFQIENQQIRAVISCMGGRIVSLKQMETGKELANISLAEERLFPSAERFELNKFEFQAEITADTPEESRVKFKYKVKPEDNRFAAGITVEKEFCIKPASYGLRITTGLKNETQEPRRPGMIAANKIGSCKAAVYPSSSGPKRFELGKDGGMQSCDNLVAGWLGLVKDENVGIAFIVDYGNISRPHMDVGNGSVEWQYDRNTIPPGQTLEFTSYIIFTEGFQSYAFASTRLISDIEVINHQVAVRLGKSFAPLPSELNLAIKAMGWTSKTDLTSTNIMLTDKDPLPFPVDKTLAMPGPSKEPFVVFCQMKGKDYAVTYDRPFSGTSGKITGYKIIPPLRDRTVLKPTGLTLTTQKRVLLLKGLYYHCFQIEEAGKKAGCTEVKGSYFKDVYYAFPPMTLSYFPETFEELYQFRVVVLADIDASCLGDTGRVMLKQFIEDGGGIFVLGGPYSFGPGSYQGTLLENLLPVSVKRTFDLIKKPSTITQAKDCPAWLAWNDKKAESIWTHDVTLKSSGKIWLKAGDAPFLIGSEMGQGRIVVTPGTPMGIARDGKVGFWETEAWQDAVVGILKWLMKEQK